MSLLRLNSFQNAPKVGVGKLGSLAGSILAHLVVIVLALTIRSTTEEAQPTRNTRQLTLLAPVQPAFPPPSALPQPNVEIPEQASRNPPPIVETQDLMLPKSAPALREFRLPSNPVARSQPLRSQAMSSLEAPEIAVAPVTQLTGSNRMPTAAPPPKIVKMGNLNAPQIAAAPVPVSTTQSAGFSIQQSNRAQPAGTPTDVTKAGFGSQNAAPAETPPARPQASTGGFGQTPVPNTETDPRSAVVSGEFGTARVSVAKSSARSSPSSPSQTPVEILSKPKPTYTAEARRLGIEGEVLLEILFSASGELKVLRIVQGLGHGLDEAAIAATRMIRFRPASSAGTAVDASAIVHIVFQLAI